MPSPRRPAPAQPSSGPTATSSDLDDLRADSPPPNIRPIAARDLTERLRESWPLGSLTVPNRVLLAPLAGIGNWFVRLQAKRYGAGMAVSEMVSSHAIHHRNERTCGEMLRIDPREREAGAGGPVSIQLFGEDPATMRSAAAFVAERGADAIDINMGCPVPKVRKTGAGAELLSDPDRAVALARAAVEGGGGLPVTVKLRSGLRPGDDTGFGVAHRLVAEAGVAAIGFHPRSAAVHHKGQPDYELAARLVATLPAPVILTGGLDDAGSVREAFEATGADAVMLARGALGNPWLFERLLGRREAEPAPEEVRAELAWTIDRAVEHLGEARAGRYLRKFDPWYLPRLGLDRESTRELQEALQSAESVDEARLLLALEERPQALVAGSQPSQDGPLGPAILLRSQDPQVP
jgi:tRNA-dihydrouridine synthase B